MYTSYTPERLDGIFDRPRSIYFIGIGGITMSSLAHIAHDRGCRVGGYDRTPSHLTERLESLGIEIFYTLSPDHIDSYDVIVYTAAIARDNPELARALECDARGEKYCVYRADFLGWLMRKSKQRIGVSGMHGKSTATAMISHIFLAAQLDPTIVLGAELDELGGAYRVGAGDSFILEACEYQDSFLSFVPNIAVVLNIDMDHPDYFHSLEQIITSFSRYLAIASDGYAVVNMDDANVRAALAGYKGRVVSFGLGSGDCDFTAANISYDHGRPEFDIIRRGEFFVHVKLSVTGQHNIMNALASAAVADICGVSPEHIAAGLSSYHGAKRRMELRGSFTTASGASVPVYDDYAHHPTEIRATLSGALRLGAKRVWVVFQPHTYTRTAALFDEFARSFTGVELIITEIYAARESNDVGVSAAKLAEAAGGIFIPTIPACAEYLRANCTSGDILISMGAGDIIKLSDLLVSPPHVAK